MLTSLSLQALNSPLKTLLEIIVKHHIEGLKNDEITCSKSDPLQSARTMSWIANSSAVSPTVMNDTQTEDSTTASVISKHVKLRYFTSVISDSLCFDFLKIDLNMYGIYFSHRSDTGEVCPSQPLYASLFPETDRLSSQNLTGFWAYDSEDQKRQPLMASLQDNDSFIRREPEKKTSTTDSTQRSRTNRIRRGMMAGPIASTSQVLDY